jgi:hypothetical protein
MASTPNGSTVVTPGVSQPDWNAPCSSPPDASPVGLPRSSAEPPPYEPPPSEPSPSELNRSELNPFARRGPELRWYAQRQICLPPIGLNLIEPSPVEPRKRLIEPFPSELLPALPRRNPLQVEPRKLPIEPFPDEPRRNPLPVAPLSPA